ncbi:MAG: dUTP diphosphatase [Clostridia bacterium]|nr:dUTP diphosphatase [Clostridia bacterium]
MSVKINIKKLRPDAIVPSYGTQFSAGADIYALPETESVTVMPGQTVFFPTGLSVEIPEGYAGLVYARSGLACKKGLAPANKVGVIDSDYRGEVMVALHNHSSEAVTVCKGERIAQLVITPCLHADFCVCSDLSETRRGEGGFGSTGEK